MFSRYLLEAAQRCCRQFEVQELQAVKKESNGVATMAAPTMAQATAPNMVPLQRHTDVAGRVCALHDDLQRVAGSIRPADVKLAPALEDVVEHLSHAASAAFRAKVFVQAAVDEVQRSLQS